MHRTQKNVFAALTVAKKEVFLPHKILKNGAAVKIVAVLHTLLIMDPNFWLICCEATSEN